MFTVLRLAFHLVLLGRVINADDGAQSANTPDGTVPVTQATTPQIRTSPTGSVVTASNGTCISRTANYITHTLPQQCLRTDWNAAVNASQTSNSGDSDAGIPAATESNNHEAGITTALPVIDSPYTQPSITTGVHSAASVSSAESSAVTSADSAPTTSPGSEEGNAAETDAESPLDNANFLSFEEWRKKTLAKAGQSPENVGQGRSDTVNRPHSGINNALDTIGDESEIDLDFSWFGSPSPEEANNAAPASENPSEAPVPEQAPPGSSTPRSKDAGKTCKERTNYASFDCAATVLKSNKECKSASSVLVEHKDSYMLNTCSADNKFLIVELCNDILIDTIVLANYEFFSSIFRHFKVSVSDRYPVKADKWKELGTFEARNTRDIQAFLVENPLIWARYLRIEFLTHYGSEYYCPVSLLRVHGTTMMQDFQQEEEFARGELQEDEEEVVSESADVALPVLPEEPILPVVDLKDNATKPELPLDEAANASDPSPKVVKELIVAPPTSVLDYPFMKGGNIFSRTNSPESTCATTIKPSETPITSQNTTETFSIIHDNVTSTSHQEADNNTKIITTKGPATATLTITTTVAVVPNSVAKPDGSSIASTQAESSVISPPTDTDARPTNMTTTGTSTQITTADESSSTAKVPIASSSNSSSIAISSSSTKASVASAASAPPPQPSTQESFFKSIHKRLQQLESNSTLSLQYIEEQSRILRDAFNKVEKRQVTDTNNFLTHLNDTVMTELRIFRHQYDQLWQSTVIELENHREKYQSEMLALSGRLTLVADELVWQKRMGIIQSTLLLLCLGFVLFAKQGNGYLEVPLMQQVMNKSQTLIRAGLESPPHSPSPDSRSPVSLFRRKIWRTNTDTGVNDVLTDASDSRPQTRDGPEYHVKPPTPDPGDEQIYVDNDGEVFGEPLSETRSSPATPSGTREKLNQSPTWPESGERPTSPLRNSS